MPMSLYDFALALLPFEGCRYGNVLLNPCDLWIPVAVLIDQPHKPGVEILTGPLSRVRLIQLGWEMGFTPAIGSDIVQQFINAS